MQPRFLFSKSGDDPVPVQFLVGTLSETRRADQPVPLPKRTRQRLAKKLNEMQRSLKFPPKMRIIEEQRLKDKDRAEHLEDLGWLGVPKMNLWQWATQGQICQADVEDYYGSKHEPKRSSTDGSWTVRKPNPTKCLDKARPSEATHRIVFAELTQKFERALKQFEEQQQQAEEAQRADESEFQRGDGGWSKILQHIILQFSVCCVQELHVNRHFV